MPCAPICKRKNQNKKAGRNHPARFLLQFFSYSFYNPVHCSFAAIYFSSDFHIFHPAPFQVQNGFFHVRKQKTHIVVLRRRYVEIKHRYVLFVFFTLFHALVCVHRTGCAKQALHNRRKYGLCRVLRANNNSC